MDLISLFRSKAKQVKETSAWVEIPSVCALACVFACVFALSRGRERALCAYAACLQTLLWRTRAHFVLMTRRDVRALIG